MYIIIKNPTQAAIDEINTNAAFSGLEIHGNHKVYYAGTTAVNSDIYQVDKIENRDTGYPKHIGGDNQVDDDGAIKFVQK